MVTGIELVEPSVPGVMTGVATVGVMVYVALATAELVYPVSVAIASTTEETDTVKLALVVNLVPLVEEGVDPVVPATLV
jgi:hypothetical protein